MEEQVGSVSSMTTCFRLVTELELTSTLTTTRLHDKITKIVDSATDTELIHMAMTDLLDADVYFRLNPYMSQPYTLDEVDPDKLEQMNKDAVSYVRRNSLKIRGAARQLNRPTAAYTLLRRKLARIMDLRGRYTPA